MPVVAFWVLSFTSGERLSAVPEKPEVAFKLLKALVEARGFEPPTPCAQGRLLADQYGVPTLVECKRQKDGRSRREVVGQMLEYAASGRHYWEASDLRSHAQSAAADEAKLIEKLKALTGSDVTPQDFFLSVEQNLQKSKMRCIFFLDDSPLELRSIVEFLNGQMKDMELLTAVRGNFCRERASDLL